MRKLRTAGTILGIGSLIFLHSIPAIEPLTSRGMTCLGVLCFAVVWWITAAVPLPVATLAALALGVLLGGLDFKEAFAGPTTWILWFVIGTFGLSSGLEVTGFNRRFALFFLNRPMLKGRPYAFLFMFHLSAVILSGFMANTVVAVLWLALATAIYSFLRMKKGNPFAEINTLGIAWAANIGGITSPIGTATNPAAIAMIAAATGYTIGFLTWTVVGYFAAALLMITTFLVFRYVARPDVMAIADPKTAEFLRGERQTMGPASRAEKWAVFWFLVAVVLWFLPELSRFVASARVTAYLNQNLGLVVPALLAPTAMCLTPVKQGDRTTVLSWEEWAKGVDWGLVVFITGVLALGTAVGAEQTGIPEFLKQRLEPWLGELSEYPFVFLMMLGVMMVTSAISNLVSLAVFLPLALTLSLSLKIGHPLAIGLLLGMGASLSYALPSGTTTNALVAGSGWLRVGTMLRYGFLLTLIHVFIMTLLVYPLAKLLLPAI